MRLRAPVAVGIIFTNDRFGLRLAVIRSTDHMSYPSCGYLWLPLLYPSQLYPVLRIENPVKPYGLWVVTL